MRREAVFRGTRVTLRTVLAGLAAGDSVADILADFPALKAEDVQAAIAFAATSGEEDMPVPAAPLGGLKIRGPGSEIRGQWLGVRGS